jgi:hypothetical protein
MIGTLRAKYLRRQIRRNRCPIRPGITHAWFQDAGPDPTSFGSVIEWWECAKCREVVR